MVEENGNGIYKGRPRWTAQQMEFIRANPNLTDEQMAQAIGRSLKSIRQKRLRLKFKKKGGRPTDEIYSKRTGKSKEQVFQERSEAISSGWAKKKEEGAQPPPTPK